MLYCRSAKWKGRRFQPVARPVKPREPSYRRKEPRCTRPASVIRVVPPRPNNPTHSSCSAIFCQLLCAVTVGARLSPSPRFILRFILQHPRGRFRGMEDRRAVVARRPIDREFTSDRSRIKENRGTKRTSAWSRQSITGFVAERLNQPSLLTCEAINFQERN